jgi:hypothetical protein
MEQKAEDGKNKAAKKMKYLLIAYRICWEVDQACEYISQSPARDVLVDFFDSSTKEMKGGLMNERKDCESFHIQLSPITSLHEKTRHNFVAVLIWFCYSEFKVVELVLWVMQGFDMQYDHLVKNLQA